MIKLTELKAYSDENGNVIEYDGPTISKGISIEIRGKDNRLIIESPTRISSLAVWFDNNNSTLRLGLNDRSRGSATRLKARLGADSEISIGRYVTMTNPCYLMAAESGSLTIGEDCMIAGNVQMRAHDSHPMFDAKTKQRLNPGKPIRIGNHVWVGAEVAVLGGANVGDGSVIGFRSIVNKSFSNNVVLVGSPAKTVRKNVAWERPNATNTPVDEYQRVAEMTDGKYWNETIIDAEPTFIPAPRRLSLLRKIRNLFTSKK